MKSYLQKRWLVALALVVALAAVALSAPALAQRFTEPPTVRTDAGNWEGTWYYMTRREKVVLWIREKGKKPEVRLRYLNTDTREGFSTDWDTRASYRFDTKQGKFLIEFKQRDKNTLAGTWIWQLGTEVGRWETAQLVIFRTAEGRSLVMKFTNVQRTHIAAGADHLLLDRNWTFHKATRSMALWEELPF